MTASASQLPTYIQMRYAENGVFDALQTDVTKAAEKAKQTFDRAFAGLGQTLKSNLSASGTGDLNLNISSYRQAAAEAKTYLLSVERLRDAEQRLQSQSGVLNATTRDRIQALNGEVSSARQAYVAAQDQVDVMSSLDRAQRDATESSRLLAQAQREVHLEQARIANLRSNNLRDINSRAAPGLDPFNKSFGPSPSGEIVSAAPINAQNSALAELVAREEEAAVAAQKLARDIELVQRAVDPTRVAVQQLDAELARASAALEAGAIDANQYGVAVNRAADNFEVMVQGARRGTDAYGNVINSTRALRTATLQAGQQVQDIGISLYSGQRAAVVFAQQLPQLAFALSGLEGSTNATHNRIGRFATFLSGPWGLAVGLGVGVLGTLVASMFDTGEAADDAKKKSETLADAIDFQKKSVDELIGSINELADAQDRQNRSSYESEQLAIANAQAALDAAIANRERAKSLIELYRAEVAPRISLLPSAAGDPAAQAYNTKALADTLRAEAELNAGVSRAEQLLRATRVPAARNEANARSDPAQAAAREYQKEEARIRESYVSGKTTLKDYNSELDRLIAKREAAIEAAREGRRRGPRGPSEETLANRARRELERLGRVSDSSAESIARINEQFDDQPRLVDKAAQAIRKLDAIQKELNDPKNANTPRRAELLVEYEEARARAAGAVGREIDRYAESNQRNLDVMILQARGLSEQAAILEEINQIDERLGLRNNERDLTKRRDDLEAILTIEQLTAAERRNAEQELFDTGVQLLTNRQLQSDVADEAERNVKATEQINQRIVRTNALMEAQVGVLETARGSLLDILSGRETDLFGNLEQSIKDLRGARLFDQLFAGAFDDLETQMRGRTPLGRATNELVGGVDTATLAFDTMASAAEDLGRRFDGVLVANDNPGTDTSSVPGTTVRAKRGETFQLAQMSVRDLSDSMAEAMVGPLLAGMGDIFGTRFTLQMKGALVGAASGYMQAGRVGSVLGGARGLVDAFGGGSLGASSLSFALGQGLAGAGFGSQFDAFADALGIPSSRTGAQIGGALFGPIGGIVGGLGGGLLKSFKSTKRGSAIIGGVGGELGITGFYGNSSTRKDAAAELAGTIFGDIDRIAEALGADVDASRGRVSIGLRDGNYRVDPQGRGYTKTSKYRDIMDFGEDAEAARRAASLNLIQDGVLVGLREGTERLLKQGDDLEAALQDALDFENVFDSLKAYKDPVGAALDTLDDRFNNLIDLFDRAGASAEELGQLEELYALERAETLQEANDRVLGSLRGFLDDLTIGDAGLSLRTRQANALAAYDPLAERVRAGDRTAYDDFTSAANALLEIERELYGSQSGYFDRFTEVTGLTRTRIDAESNVASIAENRDSPFDAAGKVRDAVTDQTTQIVSRLDALIANQISGLQATGTGGPAGYNFTNFPGFNF